MGQTIGEVSLSGFPGEERGENDRAIERKETDLHDSVTFVIPAVLFIDTKRIHLLSVQQCEVDLKCCCLL